MSILVFFLFNTFNNQKVVIHQDLHKSNIMIFTGRQRRIRQVVNPIAIFEVICKVYLIKARFTMYYLKNGTPNTYLGIQQNQYSN